jgi:hypothetical protein
VECHDDDSGFDGLPGHAPSRGLDAVIAMMMMVGGRRPRVIRPKGQDAKTRHACLRAGVERND